MNKILKLNNIKNSFFIFAIIGVAVFLLNINDAQALSASTISPYQSTVKLTSTQSKSPVSRCTGANCTNYVNIGKTDSNKIYTDSNLSCGTIYRYQVYADGNAQATTDACDPAKPTNISVVPTGQGSARVTWQDNATNETGYELFNYATDPPSIVGSTGAQNGSGSMISGDASGLSCNTSYFLYPKAYIETNGRRYYSSFPGLPAAITTDACTPATPTNISVTATGPNSATVTWKDNATNETGYELFNYATDPPSVIGATGAQNGSGSMISGDAFGLSCNTSYFLYPKAYIETNGRRYYSSFPGLPAAITTDACTPATPTNISAAATGPNSATVTWKDNATNETGYKIYNYDTLAEVGSTGADATSGTVSGLDCNTSYFLYPKAYVVSNGRTYYSAFPGLPPAITTAACYQPSLTIDPASVRISIGSSQQLTGKYDPDGASGPQVVQDITNTSGISGASWSSSDKKIVSYSSSGKITGIDQGNAIMTLNYAGLKAESNIAVITPTVVVTLSANSNSGVAPVNGVDLTASISTNITGSNTNYTYYFYCNRSDSGIDIQGQSATFAKVSETTKTAVDRCDYSSAGSYTPKVIVVRNDGGFIFSGEARTTVTVSSPAKPDLIPQNLSINGTLTAGQSLIFSGDIKNVGGATAGVSVAGFCINEKSQTQTFANCLTNRNVPSLNNNEQISINSNAWTAQQGNYEIWLVADINTTVNESEESNNAIKLDFTVQAPAVISTFVLVPPTSRIEVGATQQYIGKYDPDGPSGSQAEQTVPADQITWLANPSSVIKIDKTGLATGKSSGSGTIGGQYNGINAYATVDVYNFDVSLSADPNSGDGQVNGVDLTASVSTSITKTDPRDESTTYDFYFYCNRSDSGVNVTTDYVAHTFKFTNSQYFDSPPLVDICNYSAIGTYTPKVIVVRQPNFSFPVIIYKEARTSVVVSKPTGPLLQVTLNSGKGLSGQAPFENWLQANVVSDIEATTNFTFWWNCNNATANVQAATDACGDPDGEIGNQNGSKFDARPIGTISQGSARYVYDRAGTYTGKVIVERGSSTVEERTFPIVITAPPPPPANHAPSVTPLAPQQGNYCPVPVGNGPFDWTLSWNFSDPDGDTQSAYQVIVKDAVTGQILHDSTKIEGVSGDSKEYSLTTKGFLALNKEYSWIIKVWESNIQGLTAEASGQNFTTIKHAAPSVAFTQDIKRPAPGEQETLTDSSTVIGDPALISRRWIFSALSPDDYTLFPVVLNDPDPTDDSQVIVKFNSNGRKVVKLRVIDADGYDCTRASDQIDGAIMTQPGIDVSRTIPRFTETKPR